MTAPPPPRIALLGEFDPAFPPHAATEAAVEHARAALGVRVDAQWVSTADVTAESLARYAGLWVAPGSPYKSLGNTLWAIRHARENDVPCLGTCGGYQHILLEYARNVLGFADAQHAEYDPYASRLFISKLACSLAGRAMELRFVPGSQVATIYGGLTATERYYCNFGVAPERLLELKRGPLAITGADDEGEARVVELPGHAFFIGTLFVPQARSAPGAPHPLVTAFLKAVAGTRT
jgi:CTP synthase (UTP-ammonia lyase)